MIVLLDSISIYICDQVYDKTGLHLHIQLDACTHSVRYIYNFSSKLQLTNAIQTSYVASYPQS